MEIFVSRLRQRAKELGISNAEAGRRAGLSERRYANYIIGNREPDLATVVRIAKVLGTSPNWLLGFDDADAAAEPSTLPLERLNFAARALSADDLRVLIAQAEAIVRLRASGRAEEGDVDRSASLAEGE
jgi:transcriptional regulator with XRE-family HTH domain